jgi:hypothetical protein
VRSATHSLAERGVTSEGRETKGEGGVATLSSTFRVLIMLNNCVMSSFHHMMLDEQDEFIQRIMANRDAEIATVAESMTSACTSEGTVVE